MRELKVYALGFVVLTVFYGLLRIYFRSLRKERFEKAWGAEKPEGTSREDYVRQGLKDYDRSIRPKLIALVYVVPFIVISVTIYMVDW